jgi:TldD protein
MFDTDVLQRVFNIPAKFIDVSVQFAEINHVLLEDGVAKEVTSGQLRGAGIRVLSNAWGFASTTELENILSIAEKAYKGSKNGSLNLKLARSEAVRDEVGVKPKRDPADLSFEERREMLHEAEQEIRDCKHVASYSIAMADSKSTLYYLNSEGACIKAEYPRTAFSVVVFGKKNGRLQVASERLGGVGGVEVVENFRSAAREAAEKVQRLLDAEEAPRGYYRVVLDPRLAGVFIHEAVGHAVEADHVLQGESVLEDKLGEKIAPETVTLYDDPTLKGAYGFYFYDSEGVKARKKPVLEKGVLMSFLNSRETAVATAQELTGNARAQSFDYPPMVRMSNTYLEPGDYAFEELLEDIKIGVYLKGSKGGEVDTARGVFQFNAEEGFLIEKGELTRAIKDVSLSGSTLDTLGRIDALGKDFEMHIGYCNKDMQSVPVGDGGPHVRTRALVGGTKAWTRRRH